MLTGKTVARSLLGHPSTTKKPIGHESRLIAVAEACKTYSLPNELVLMVLDFVEPIDMYRVRFTEPGEERWLVAEDA